MKHIERVIILFIVMRECKSYVGVCAALFGYLHDNIDGSMYSIVKDYLIDALAMDAQDGDEDPADGTPKWLEIFRSVTRNWKSVSKMPAWKYVQKILSVSVAAGLCKAADVTSFAIGDMQLFTLKIEERQASAFDLIDAILSTADYFVEAGYEALKTKSLRPFFFDNQTARILDDAYIGISASMAALSTGDLSSTSILLKLNWPMFWKTR
jgi:hypothetical protein